MHSRKGDVKNDVMDLGSAICVADDLRNLISGGETFMRVDIPSAQYRSWDGKNSVNRSVSNYANSWTNGLDWRDHLIVAPQGVFTIGVSERGRHIFARLQQYLTANGFKVEISPSNTQLFFKSQYPARALYINKYPHTNGTDLSILDFQDRLKYISVFHQELPPYKQAHGMGDIVPWPDHQELPAPSGTLESMPAEYKAVLTSNTAMKALRDNLVTLAQVAAMPTVQHVKCLFTPAGMQALREGVPAYEVACIGVRVQQMANSVFGLKRPEGHDDLWQHVTPTHRP